MMRRRLFSPDSAVLPLGNTLRSQKKSANATLPASERLEQLPNIGRSIAADLRGIGIHTPAQLAEAVPLEMYRALADPMGRRHDPCVLYTLLAAKHFLQTGEACRWWAFTEQGRQLLAATDEQRC